MPRKILVLVGGILLVLALSECGSRNDQGTVEGEVRIDGSSTVYPITEAVAEEFRLDEPRVRVTVGVSGTGGGFNKFGRGEIDINNASRPIKEREASQCEANNLKFIGIRVAYDGLVVVVSKQNKWLNEISVEELKRIWEPEAQGKITRWSQINPEWPNEEFHLYGPGIASGTYDYFTEAVVGKAGSSRGDYTASEDDNVLVQGISGDKNGLAFFGLAYYEENKEKLRVIGVDGGDGVVMPSEETVKNGQYMPLSRPIFIYVSDIAAARPEVRSFVKFYLDNANFLVSDVGYIPLTNEEYKIELAKFEAFLSDEASDGSATERSRGLSVNIIPSNLLP